MVAQGVPMTPELLVAVRARDAQQTRESSTFEIWPDMATAVVLFFALDTQWKRGAFGDLHGLDYSAIRPTADLLGLVLEESTFHDLRIMESETLRAVRKSRG